MSFNLVCDSGPASSRPAQIELQREPGAQPQEQSRADGLDRYAGRLNYKAAAINHECNQQLVTGVSVIRPTQGSGCAAAP